MKIEITVNAPELSEAINNLASAIGKTNVVPFTEPEVKKEVIEDSKTEKESEKPEVKLSAKEQKEIFLAKILEAGGIPPEKGPISKYQEALKEALENGNTPEESEQEESEQEESEQEESEQEENTDETPVNRDTVRAFAANMVKSKPQDGKKALGEILAELKAEKVSSATQEQLEKMVPMLEKASGKKF